MSTILGDNRPLLLVEDDQVDRMTVKRAVRKLKIGNTLHTADNGEKALEYLKKNRGKLPCIILLDINMPRMNGIEFLKIIKKDDDFKSIPVIILTTSEEERDRYESFNLSIAGYVVKPVDFDAFIQVMDVIKQYWSMMRFPEKKD